MLRGMLSLLAALALVAPAASYAAADTVIGFDDKAAGTEITDQYKAQGLVLGRDYSGPLGGPPTVTGAGPDREAALYESCGGEFCNSNSDFLAGRVDFARKKIKLTVTDGTHDGRPGACDTVSLKALTGAGNVIGTATPPPGATAPYDLEVDSTSQNIQFFELCGVRAIDDITFDNPDTPPPADFSFAPQYDPFSGTGTVNVVTGNTVNLPVIVNRFNQSTGNIQVSLSGLPGGVTTAGFPKPVNTPDGAQFTIPITAAKDAPPASVDVTVTGVPQAFAGSANRTFKFTLNVLAQSDLRVSGIEVTQGIQTQFTPCSTLGSCATAASLPARNPSDPSAAVAYSGVQLVSHRKTFARVFANRAFPGGNTPTTGATITLTGMRNGKTLPGSPLTVNAPPLLPGGNATTLPERTDPSKDALFVLPDSWTGDGNLTLIAHVEPALAFIGTEGATDCQTTPCKQNNSLRMDSIPFENTGYVDLATAKLWVPGESLKGVNIPCCFETQNGLEKFYPDPQDVFKYPEAVLPLREGGLSYDPYAYYASIDASEVLLSDADDRTDDALDLLDDYADDYPGCESRNFCADQIIGVYGNEISTAGVSHGDVADSDHSGVANYRRPDSATHEMSHGYGREHASKGCGGDDGGQDGEDWPPDSSGQHGYMDGIGYDRRNGGIYAQRSLGAFGSSSNPTGPGDPLSFSFQPNLWFDYMSYCRVKEGQDAGIWTSVRGWNENLSGLRSIADELDRLRALRSRSVPAPTIPGVARAAGAGTALLRVRVTARPDDTAAFDSVKPRDGKARVGATGSPYAAVTKDASGKVLSTTSMIVEPKHIEGAAAAESALLADVPATGAHAIDVLHNGVLIASRIESANAPKVRVISPRKGSRIGGKRTVTLRWKATDADGDRLRMKVDYSTDGGANWVPIFLGPNKGTTTIPSYLFAGSRRARVRVRANDGFAETAALSGIFFAAGRKPDVQIISPAARQRVRADETLVLTGQAFDDRHRKLSGKKLAWFDGRRRLGRGASIAVTGLRAGKRKLRLVATDATGRKGQAAVAIRVAAVTPKLLEATAPASVPAAATSFKLRVAASVPAKLTVGAQTFKVGRKAKDVTIKVTPGTDPLVLTLKLTAAGKSSAALLTVPRG